MNAGPLMTRSAKRLEALKVLDNIVTSILNEKEVDVSPVSRLCKGSAAEQALADQTTLKLTGNWPIPASATTDDFITDLRDLVRNAEVKKAEQMKTSNPTVNFVVQDAGLDNLLGDNCLSTLVSATVKTHRSFKDVILKTHRRVLLS